MKLLKFNEYYGDEHDVSALACFTDEEFDTWCHTSMGKLNPNYEFEIMKHNERVEKYDSFIKNLQEKGLHTKPFSSYTPEEKKWYDINKIEYISRWDKPKKASSYLHAYLGNNGEGFSESYDEFLTGQDFIDAGIVTVFDVSEEFYNTFHETNLADISMCNIFTCDFNEDIDYED